MLIFLKKYFLGFLIVLTATSQNVYAFYKAVENHHKSPVESEELYITDSSKSGSFAIYDFMMNQNVEYKEGKLLQTLNDNFVPADIIDCNVLLKFLLKSEFSSTEDLLDNLLYANLKFKKLMDEYNYFQLETRKNIKIIEKEKLQALSISFDSRPDGFSYAGQVFKNDMHQTVQGNNLKGSYISNETDIAAAKQISFTFPTQSFHEQQVTRSSSGSFLPSKRENTVDLSIEEKENKADKNRPVRSADKNLPWFFKVSMQITKYMLSHKLEAVMIGMFFLIFISFLSSLLMRK